MLGNLLMSYLELVSVSVQPMALRQHLISALQQQRLYSRSTCFLTQHRYVFYSGKLLFGSRLCMGFQALVSGQLLHYLESGQGSRQEKHL
jgi:hypothetical protein